MTGERLVEEVTRLAAESGAFGRDGEGGEGLRAARGGAPGGGDSGVACAVNVPHVEPIDSGWRKPKQYININVF